MNIQIIKRDGTKEPFDEEKIDRVVVAAGLSPDNATTLVNNLKTWVQAQNKQEFSSLEIRDQVMIEMQKLDVYAANMFSWYQKTKDNTQ